MGLESAIRRMGELQALTGGHAQSGTAGTQGAATGPNGQPFSSYLNSAQSQSQVNAMQLTQPGSSTRSMLPSGSPASALPIVSAAGLGGLDSTGASAGLSTPYSAAAGYGLGVGSSQYGLGGTPSYGVGNPYVGGNYSVGGVGSVGQPYAGGGVGQQMVALAQREIGVTESGGNNDSPRIREYRKATAGAENTPGPWCAYFVSWLAQQSGAPINTGGKGTGWVPQIETWGKQTDRWHTDSRQAQPGDIVIFDRNGDGLSDHTGIVESVDAQGRVHTIEGNTSDRVARRDYAPSQIRGYVRPG